MKSLMNSLSILLAVFSLVFVTSCGSDDDIVIDPGTGINVADGFYFAASGSDPVSTAGLVSENVEDDGFSSQERTGFLGGYIYFAQGDYNLVQIASKEITSTLGGTAEVVTDAGSGCDFNDYYLVNATVDGAAFTVPADGLYRVTYDQTTGEVIMFNVTIPGIIGSATEGGWGADTQLSGTVDADGGSWSAENVILREGEFKLRFNCRWSIDRRIDPAAGFGFDNGYQLFNNFGGSFSDLAPGNNQPNIPFAAADEGIYTVTANWDPTEGWSMVLVRTGDAPVVNFVPDEHEWAVVGDATNLADADMNGTPDGWEIDTDMNYEGFDSGTNTYTWKIGFIGLGVGGFKFRTNDSWDENIGWGQVALEGDVADFTDDGGNIRVNTARNYEITLTTSDDGDNYTATFVQL